METLKVKKDLVLEALESFPEAKEAIESLFPEIVESITVFCTDEDLFLIKGKSQVFRFRNIISYDLKDNPKSYNINIISVDGSINFCCIISGKFRPGRTNISIDQMKGLLRGFATIEDITLLNEENIKIITNLICQEKNLKD